MTNTSDQTPTDNNQRVWAQRLGAVGMVIGAVSALAAGGGVFDMIFGAAIWTVITGLVGVVIDKRSDRR